jgi:hypothetical protein
VNSLTIKLQPAQEEWLAQRARLLKRSKGDIVRELIQERLAPGSGSLGQALSDLRGSLSGSRDLSTRPLKGYGRS